MAEQTPQTATGGEAVNHKQGDAISRRGKMCAYVVVGAISVLVVLGGCFELADVLLEPLTPFWSPGLSPYQGAYVHPIGLVSYTPSLREVAVAAVSPVVSICIGLWGCRFAVRRLLAARAREWSS
jgi:hypothetical protein